MNIDQVMRDGAYDKLDHDRKEGRYSPQHTPTRTINTPLTLVQGENRATIIDAAGKAIGYLHPWLLESEQESVVLAVNCREELLGTLRFVRQTVHQAYDHIGSIEDCRKNTCDAVTQAIAKAEGK